MNGNVYYKKKEENTFFFLNEDYYYVFNGKQYISKQIHLLHSFMLFDWPQEVYVNTLNYFWSIFFVPEIVLKALYILIHLSYIVGVESFFHGFVLIFKGN